MLTSVVDSILVLEMVNDDALVCLGDVIADDSEGALDDTEAGFL